jgi:hypothetical protein
MVTVHSYKRWDIARDRYVTTRLKGTPNYIDSIEGEIIRNTAEHVSPRDMDGKGRYDPEAKDNETQFDQRLFLRVGGMQDGGFGTAGATGPGRADKDHSDASVRPAR